MPELLLRAIWRPGARTMGVTDPRRDRANFETTEAMIVRAGQRLRQVGVAPTPLTLTTFNDFIDAIGAAGLASVGLSGAKSRLKQRGRQT